MPGNDNLMNGKTASKMNLKSKKSSLKTKKEEVPENDLLRLKSQLVRALADYDNLRKRVDAEREVWVRYSAERVLVKLLPSLDNFETAQSHLGDSGLAIAIGEFRRILEEEGLEEVKPNSGDEFNPEIHEAVEVVEGGKSGTVSELVLSGWRFKESESLPAGRQVVRYAKVKVFK